ncbi:MAG: hypothetical protein ACOC9J_05320, partial [Persicimonas sp.]
LQDDPPFGEDSPHWIRLQCARVFGGIIEAESLESNAMCRELGDALGGARNAHSQSDIRSAIRLLEAEMDLPE